MRLDHYIVQKYGWTRNKSQQYIKLWLIIVNESPCIKSAFEVWEHDNIYCVEDRRIRWVSRSAQKLADFLEEKNIAQYITIAGKCCLDVWASTGWFTQVLIELWAKHVDAVDVWTNQLHPSLRSLSQISSYEQCDIRNFLSDHSKTYDIIVCDASFISLKEIFPSILDGSNQQTEMILLFKPQFEVGPEALSKHGIVKNFQDCIQAMNIFEQWVIWSKCVIMKKIPSSLKGETGNQEWIYWIRRW
jgi:23S rRNA (cytidine1920-2'-O)/16S rRNA (cytidine1409-2'-O)-methyltransferase